MWDLTFYLANTPPLPVPRLDDDIGTSYNYNYEEGILNWKP